MNQWPLPRVLAHRCGGTLAPENTLIGLEFAIAHRCFGVEFDVMLSSNGTPVLIHDETLDRTTDGHGRVCDTPDSALLLCDAGTWHSARFAGERVPLFADAIRRCRALGITANVEIKPAEGFEVATGRITAATAAAGWAGAEVQPLLSSFCVAALAAAAETAPHLPRAILFDQLPPDWREQVRALDAQGVVCNTRRLDAATIAAVKHEGLRLAVYTENDPLRARQLFDWGVDSVITDRPDLVTANV
ncbi:glycerophosphodiester phosphodiesterase [Niveibacterium sp.]|uniref:glycerophosphodiester phosphodiesterase n=1 Tax=Niveibacterium sp. TaxID=2017444 RepID=UPI0035AFF226